MARRTRSSAGWVGYGAGVLVAFAVLALVAGGAFNGSMQHEARMEVSWCDDVARA